MLKVKEFRKARGWTQLELSKISGVSRSYISEIENDGRSVSVEYVCMLCKAFECTPNELIDECYWK